MITSTYFYVVSPIQFDFQNTSYFLLEIVDLRILPDGPRRGDTMVAGATTTYTISTYHHKSC